MELLINKSLQNVCNINHEYVLECTFQSVWQENNLGHEIFITSDGQTKERNKGEMQLHLAQNSSFKKLLFRKDALLVLRDKLKGFQIIFHVEKFTHRKKPMKTQS